MQWLALAVFVALTALAASFGAQFMPDAWYVGLAKPSWNPPNWVFGPVWTLLYIMIAVAGWLAWRALGFGAAVTLWGAQMLLNGLWSYLFFGRYDITLAFVDIVLLLAAIVAFIVATWSRARPAALLFLPYLAWVSFASALNLAILRLNG